MSILYGNWLRSVILIFLVLPGLAVQSQILRKPDPQASLDPLKGVLVIESPTPGSLYLNNKLLLNLRRNDTVYILNLTPGRYDVTLISEGKVLKNDFIMESRKVFEIKNENDSLRITRIPRSFVYLTDKLTVWQEAFVKRDIFYSILQTSLLTLTTDMSQTNPGIWFRSFTAINGYQAGPGFSIGLGISFNYYNIQYQPDPNIPAVTMRNLPFLPIYVDLRSHFSNKKVAPFIKFDIGYNILLSEKELSFKYNYYSSPIQTKTGYYYINGGGIWFSPGFGFRIAINKLIQVIITAEYSYDAYKSYEIRYATEKSEINGHVNCFKFNIGVGFQKKLIPPGYPKKIE